MSKRAKKYQELTHEMLLGALDYNPETGIFTAKPRGGAGRGGLMFDGRFAGKPAGTIDNKGYRAISLFYRTYKAHRLAWFYVTGRWPSETIDHINRKKDDNRICNLRDVTQQEQMKNWSRLQPQERCPGLHYYKDRGKYRAVVKIGGSVHQVGWFATAEEALAAQNAYRVATA